MGFFERALSVKVNKRSDRHGVELTLYANRHTVWSEAPTKRPNMTQLCFGDVIHYRKKLREKSSETNLSVALAIFVRLHSQLPSPSSALFLLSFGRKTQDTSTIPRWGLVAKSELSTLKGGKWFFFVLVCAEIYSIQKRKHSRWKKGFFFIIFPYFLPHQKESESFARKSIQYSLDVIIFSSSRCCCCCCCHMPLLPRYDVTVEHWQMPERLRLSEQLIHQSGKHISRAGKCFCLMLCFSDERRKIECVWNFVSATETKKKAHTQQGHECECEFCALLFLLAFFLGEHSHIAAEWCRGPSQCRRHHWNILLPQFFPLSLSLHIFTFCVYVVLACSALGSVYRRFDASAALARRRGKLNEKR